jgi:hypothetical protein
MNMMATQQIFPSFSSLSVWDMRQVVNSWAPSHDLAWALGNCPSAKCS